MGRMKEIDSIIEDIVWLRLEKHEADESWFTRDELRFEEATSRLKMELIEACQGAK